MTIPGAGGGRLHNYDRELYPHLKKNWFVFNMKKTVGTKEPTVFL